MDYLVKILSFFWFIRTLKYVLFWIFLWQLKEYHIPRFIDHFRTYKGKKIFLNPFFISKILLFLALLMTYASFDAVLYVLLTAYLVEAILFVVAIFRGNVKKPVFTPKTSLLMLVTLLIFGVVLFAAYSKIQSEFWFVFAILAIDIIAPLIVTLVVLLFQPIFVLGRNRIIKKAIEKIKKFDKLVVIGITGSYGKTSTKEFLTTILSKKFNVLSTKEHQNSEIGISNCILKDLNQDHQIFIVEMGAYKKGGISLLCDIVHPSIGIVTGVNEQHLSLFGLMDNLLSAEGGRELLEALPKNGLLVVNGDNKHCVDLYKKAKTCKRIYSEKGNKIDSNVWAEEISVNKDSLDFMAMTKDKEAVHFNINVLGGQNIQNLLGAILVAKELGISLLEISKACRDIKPEQAGITLKAGAHNINVIDSSYSANPDGVMADLEYLNIFKGKKVIVMPCLIELGKKSQEVHYQIGQKIAEVCDMAIITTKERFLDIKNGAVSSGIAEDPIRNPSDSNGASKIIFSDKPKDIFHTITTFCKEGDTVLLEGGRPKELIKLLIEK